MGQSWGIGKLVVCYLMNMLPRSVLRKDGLKLAIILDFVCLFCALVEAGPRFALLIMLFLTLFHVWVRYTGNYSTTLKRVLFIATLGFCGLFLLAKLIQVPIRIARHDPEPIISANVIGLLWAVAMMGNLVEFAIRRGIWSNKVSCTVGTEADLAPDSQDPEIH
ncbi:MAG: hypothetical protein KDA68_20770 [Planctomycetaceae bacterium]|nr:hypothetical protein [Planctomycetaceae bacterium]